MKSRIIRGTSKNARFFLADTTEIVQKALDIHECSPTAIAAFGRFLTAGVIMGMFSYYLLTLITSTDGLVQHMTVTANGKGEVKGYLSNPQADLPPRPTGRPDVANLVQRKP